MLIQDHDIAPCLRDSPISESANALVAATRAPGDSRFASMLRAYSAAILYNGMEQIFASSDDPIVGLNSSI